MDTVRAMERSASLIPKLLLFVKLPCKTKHAASVNTPVKEIRSDEYGNVFYLFSAHELITWNPKTNTFSFENNFFKQKKNGLLQILYSNLAHINTG